MKKSVPVRRRVLGRQVASEMADEDLGRVHGRERGIEIQGTRTCDGSWTYSPRGKDCTGGAGADDDAYEF